MIISSEAEDNSRQTTTSICHTSGGIIGSERVITRDDWISVVTSEELWHQISADSLPSLRRLFTIVYVQLDSYLNVLFNQTLSFSLLNKRWLRRLARNVCTYNLHQLAKIKSLPRYLELWAGRGCVGRTRQMTCTREIKASKALPSPSVNWWRLNLYFWKFPIIRLYFQWGWCDDVKVVS